MATVAIQVGRQSKRSIWWRVHQWAGLQLSLFLAFILATGTIATLSHEIDWLLNPAMRVQPVEEARASWGELAASAQATIGASRIERISAPIASRFAVEAIAMDSDGKRFRIQLDPWTAEVRGITSWINAQRILRELHRHLMLPIDWGLPLVTILSLPLLASAVTSFWVYKKWWRGFFRLPRRRRERRGDARRFTGDLHRFAGLWSLWFVMLIGLTGLWYLVEWGGGNAPPVTLTAETAPAQPRGAVLNGLVAKTRTAYPALRISSIYFPDDAPGGVVVMGQAESWLVRERANAVLLDAERGIAVQRLRGAEMTAHQRISEAADPLHFGTWGGFTTRIFWFLCGAALTGLAVTGVLIYGLRLRQEPAVQAGRGIRASMWRGMGIMAWPSLILIVLAFALIPIKLTGE